MAVNWKDIQDRSEKFVVDYRDARDEDRDAKPFWKDLMTLYGVEARSVGAFEERVRVHGRPGVGKIDYFAPRQFLIEHKSRGEDLDKAYKQALEYFDSLASELRPRYIVVSDFARIRVHDLEKEESDRISEFALEELPSRVRELAFFAEEDVRIYKPEEHIDVKAVRVVGKLHKALKTSNYPQEDLPRLLTRLVFCFFADDIGIFEKNAMRHYLEENTREDGADVGEKLHNIFEVLDTPDGTAGSRDERQAGTLDTLRDLPWVNGGMFKGPVRLLQGDREIRDMLIECMSFDWSQVSPAIFGSMFQSIMNEKERHDLGAHYTSETNIKKVINGLFLEELQKELDVAATNKDRLNALWDKIARITLLDPACGCGNFLVISYRELRTIENEIIRRIHGREDKRSAAHAQSHARLGLANADLDTMSKLSIERMYGIEIDQFAAEVAKLSLWLVDHKMNIELGRIFDQTFRKLPLKEQPHIVQDNALRIDWESVVQKDKLTHILGNPPFLGKHMQTLEQKSELLEVFGGVQNASDLDYVAAWYRKATEYIQGTKINCAFVSTNSITQGEQVSILWPDVLSRGVRIQFAHRTFKWTNEATGKAAVYCVIIGFGLTDAKQPKLFEYDDIRGEPRMVLVTHINPYLVDASNVVVEKRQRPLCEVPIMRYGNKPSDSGALILSTMEKDRLIVAEPVAKKWLRPYVGAEEFLNGGTRWCLWLVGITPDELRAMPEVVRRVQVVKDFRELSTAKPTREAAKTPWLFFYVSQPTTDYILIPETSSENREWIPFGFVSKDVISSNATYHIPEPNLYVFGVLQSTMHMAWVRTVAGRLKSDYRYTGSLVYNTYPWPEKVGDAQKKAVEDAAQNVLDVRAKYPTSTLADLYDPLTMPQDLLVAHKALDKAVDACYGVKGFKSEPERLEFLFELYKKLTASESKEAPAKKFHKKTLS